MLQILFENVSKCSFFMRQVANCTETAILNAVTLVAECKQHCQACCRAPRSPHPLLWQNQGVELELPCTIIVCSKLFAMLACCLQIKSHWSYIVLRQRFVA